MAKTKPADSKNEWFWDQVHAYLGKQGLKQTRQRRQIMETFLKFGRHVDAEALHQIMRQQGNDIGLATIYRTLNLLRDAGVADEQSFGGGRVQYEPTAPDRHHDHLVCLDCGAIIEFENDEIERLQEAIAEKRGFQLKSHRLDLFGNCIRPQCNRRPNLSHVSPKSGLL